MIATLYILDYHNKKQHISGLAHVVSNTIPTGQQYLVVHSSSPGHSTIHVPNVGPTTNNAGHTILTVPGHGSLDSPSPDNSLIVPSIEKTNLNSRGGKVPKILT